jgi:hypothetical protein
MWKGSKGFCVVALAVAACTGEAEPSSEADAAARPSCDCGIGLSALLPAYCGGVESAEDALCVCTTVCDAEANDCRILPEPQAGLPRCPEPSSGAGASASVEWADASDFDVATFEGEVEATAHERRVGLRPLDPDARVVRVRISADGLAWRPQWTPPVTLSVRQETPWWTELAIDVTDANGLVFAKRSGSFDGVLGGAGGPVRLEEGEATCVGYSEHSGYVPDEAHRMEITLGGESWTIDRGTQVEREVGGKHYVVGLSVADEILDHCTTDMPPNWIEFFVLRL